MRARAYETAAARPVGLRPPSPLSSGTDDGTVLDLSPEHRTRIENSPSISGGRTSTHRHAPAPYPPPLLTIGVKEEDDADRHTGRHGKRENKPGQSFPSSPLIKPQRDLTAVSGHRGITGAPSRHLRAPPGAMRPRTAPRTSRGRTLSETGTTEALHCRADLKAGTVGQRLRGDALRDSVPRGRMSLRRTGMRFTAQRIVSTPLPGGRARQDGPLPCRIPLQDKRRLATGDVALSRRSPCCLFWAGQFTVFSCAKVVSSVFARQGLLRLRGEPLSLATLVHGKIHPRFGSLQLR